MKCGCCREHKTLPGQYFCKWCWVSHLRDYVLGNAKAAECIANNPKYSRHMRENEAKVAHICREQIRICDHMVEIY